MHNLRNRLNQYTARIIYPLFLFGLALAISSCVDVPTSFEFDDGTTQGWKETAIHDDKGVFYYPPAFFTLAHFEGAQYPSPFPQGDSLTDKKGCLSLFSGNLSSDAMENAGFPITSETWGIITYFRPLDKASDWQNIKGVSAAIGDSFATEDGHLKATIALWVDLGTKSIQVFEVDSNKQPVYHPLSNRNWKVITSKPVIPSGGTVTQVSIQIVGDWKDYKAYDGGLCIDHVTPIK